MGCGGSQIEIEKHRRQKQHAQGRVQNEAPKPVRADNSESLNFYFEAITNGCKSIAAPSNMMPVVCLSKESFPIITSFLHLEDSTPTDIQLPVVAASFLGSGRVVVFSQLQFLTPKCLHVPETLRLVLNAIQWISDGQSSMTPIYAYGFDKAMLQIVNYSCQEMGFFLESGGFRQSFSNYKAVLIPSNIDVSDPKIISGLVEYVQNGGGLAVFYNHTEYGAMAMPINKLLFKFNLAFTYCFLNEDDENSENIVVPNCFTFVHDSNFIPLLRRFKDIVKQNHVDTSALDDLVTTLRYYIMVCDEGHAEQLTEIAEYSWEFLNRTHYHTEDGICPKLTHGIVAVLLIDLYTKLPLESVKPIPEASILPGLTGEVELGDHDVTVELVNETWISTGLWLPAGVIGTVECTDYIPDVHVQIGSHHESLVTKQAPWKRWPLTVCVNPLSEQSTKVVSPFGGIVYIAVNNMSEQITQPIPMRFHNFCRHPVAHYADPSLWEATKDLEVPWGELVTENVIFTLPTEVMKRIGDFGPVFENFAIIVKELSSYMSYTVERPYRFVFDVELPDDSPSCGYPLVFLEDDIDDILCSFDQPSTQLFTAVTLMAIVSIREDCFDAITETAIATIATSVIFQRLFPGFDPLQFSGIMLPTLFHELWEIHSNFDPTLIPNTLAIFQDPTCKVSDVPDDMWIAFVREMCRVGKRNFTRLLDRSRPIPLNISISLQGLEQYLPSAAFCAAFGSSPSDSQDSVPQ